MNLTRSRTSPSAVSLGASRFDPDEIRRLVQVGKERGLIRAADEAVPVDRSGGQDAAAEGGLHSRWMEVDPPTAKRWLENNFRNRPVSEDVVTAYARDMANGTWVATHQGIAFNDRDELIDGQHRLLAIIKSGRAVRMMVTFGLPSKIEGSEMTTMDAVDRGRTRSVADQLKIQHGFDHAGVMASVCASLGNLCSPERTRRLSVGQTLEIFRAFELPIRWVVERRPKQPGLRQAGVLAAFAFAAAAQSDMDERRELAHVKPMFERLVSGEALAEGTALAHLRGFLVSDDAKLLVRSMNRGLAELVLEALRLEGVAWTGEKLVPSTQGAEQFRTVQAARVEKVAAMFRL